MAANEHAALTRADRAARLRGIYLILNDGPQDPLAIADAGLAAGVRVIQYRAKRGIAPKTVAALRAVTSSVGALLLLNDDYRAAVAFDCDGVHLGPGDAGFDDVAEVRRSLGERLIGLSCGTEDEARAAYESGADYAGAGSVYATSSKEDAGVPIGVDGLQRIVAAAALPVVAIGGIDAARIADVRASGASMAAVISAVAGRVDHFAAAVELVQAWERASR